MYFRPASKEELFNLWHAQAWNIIEHIIGVLKHCFRILVIPPEYSIKVQAQIPSALCAIYNFIKINHPNEEELPKSINSEYSSPIPDPGDDTVRWTQSTENDEIEDIKIWRDRIAQDMWEDFHRNLEAREGSRSGHYDDDYDEYFSEDGLETDLFI